MAKMAEIRDVVREATLRTKRRPRSRLRLARRCAVAFSAGVAALSLAMRRKASSVS